MIQRVLAVGVFLCLYTVCLAVTVPNFGVTTKWPEICRVMRKTRNCSDVTYRLACGQTCDISCSPGFYYLGDSGNCYGMALNTVAVWGYATDYCNAYTATLAVIEDAQDSKILTYLKAITMNNEIRFSLGALNAGTSQDWIWNDGRTFNGNHWAAGYPYVDAGNANCLVAYANEEFKHEVNGCNQNIGFVCMQTPIADDKTA